MLQGALAGLIWTGIYAGISEAIPYVAKSLGFKTPEDVQHEINEHNKEVKRQMVRHIREKEQRRESHETQAALGAAAAAAGDMLDPTIGQMEPVPLEPGVPGTESPPDLFADPGGLPADYQMGPPLEQTVAAPPNDPAAPILQMLGDPALADKLVASVKTRGGTPTVLDRMGILT